MHLHSECQRPAERHSHHGPHTYRPTEEKIVEERDRRLQKGEKSTQQALGLWVKINFKLTKAPSKAALSRLFAQSAFLSKNNPRHIAKKRRNKLGKSHALEDALFNWVCEQHACRININGDMIRYTALKSRHWPMKNLR